MTRVNGKNKGNTFERKIANTLSARFEPRLGISQGFTRNPDSGSFFGGSNSRRTQTHSLDYAVFGDLITPRDFLFTIECKHYKEPPGLGAVIRDSVTQWDKWIAQASTDATSSGKNWMLIVKYNNVVEMVFLEKEIPGLTPQMNYRGHPVYRLDSVLSQPDDFFFKSQD